MNKEQELWVKILSIMDETLGAGLGTGTATDRITSLIKDKCWLKGEQEAPKSDGNILNLTLKALVQAGFKPCEEWENED